jgi:hypothetical protein
MISPAARPSFWHLSSMLARAETEPTRLNWAAANCSPQECPTPRASAPARDCSREGVGASGAVAQLTWSHPPPPGTWKSSIFSRPSRPALVSDRNAITPSRFTRTNVASWSEPPRTELGKRRQRDQRREYQIERLHVSPDQRQRPRSPGRVRNSSVCTAS